MTLQEIYSRVFSIAAMKVEGVELGKLPAVADLAAALDKAVRADAAKKAGTGNALKTVEKMLATCAKAGRKAIAYPWTDKQGRQCTCDGFRAYRLTAPLNLPERPENAGKEIDLAQIFPASAAGMVELTLPARADLVAHIAAKKAENGNTRRDVLYSFGDGLPTVNAAYLLDLMTVMDTPRLYFKTPVAPLYCVAENGDAILLPVRTFTAAPAKVEKPAEEKPAAPVKVETENAAPAKVEKPAEEKPAAPAKVESVQAEPAALIAAREKVASGAAFAEMTLEEFAAIAEYIAA